ncbi:hypothetical protein LCGC14_0358550 [marine sediment metagenome]|uniref:Methyltransferase type 11 domain-containing protein n=1 Tax=marine sediment metagenome TaxID=412755 RepID=A0A0F9T8N3_9ZZZZ
MFIAMEKLDCYETVGNRSYGNELFQYAALKIYAKERGCEVQIPKGWIGRELFEGCNDPVLSSSPRPHIDLGSSQLPIWSNGVLGPDCDVYGYFQYHTSHYAPYKDFFRKLFVPKNELREKTDSFLRQHPRGVSSSLICIHIRRGDYCNPPNRVAPSQWYVDWLDKNLERFDNPTIFIASDDLEMVIPDFKKYAPVMCKPTNEAMGMFLDHYVMQHADVLLASNSTFSFTAAMLNEKGGEFWRPDYQGEKLVSFDPWDSDPISPFPHHKAVKLHLGCGRQRLEGYVNIDCRKSKGTDVVCDIRALPYAENSVDTIESYHVFEHMPVCLHANVDDKYGEKYGLLITVLKEWYRVLKPGGNLVIEMPDLDKVLEVYLEADEAGKEKLLIGIYGSFRGGDDTDIHRWGANEARLDYMLVKAGFKYIKFTEAQDYHRDFCPCLRVEAIK